VFLLVSAKCKSLLAMKATINIPAETLTAAWSKNNQVIPMRLLDYSLEA